MTLRAPRRLAPWMQFSPTPPVPTTTTWEPVVTWAVFTTAPKPVMTPQASSEALAKGISVGMATAWEASTTAYSAKAPVSRPWVTGWPSFVVSGLFHIEVNLVSH